MPWIGEYTFPLQQYVQNVFAFNDDFIQNYIQSVLQTFRIKKQYLEYFQHCIVMQGSLIDPSVIIFIFNDARYQVEMAVTEYSLAIEKPSTIELAALQNACNRLPLQFRSSMNFLVIRKMISSFAKAIQAETLVSHVQDRLYKCLMENPSSVFFSHKESTKSKKPRMSSPNSSILSG